MWQTGLRRTALDGKVSTEKQEQKKNEYAYHSVLVLSLNQQERYCRTNS